MFLDLLRYFISQCQYCQYLNLKQAGLIMYYKEFEQFVWEEEWQVLTMPYFYLGKYLIPVCNFDYYLRLFFKHLFFLALEVDYPS